MKRKAINDPLPMERRETVPASNELFERGCALAAQRKDKAWSLTDCFPSS